MSMHSELTQEMRESLVSRRCQLGWTHKDCASYFGVEISTYRNWENGKTRMLMSDQRWALLQDFVGGDSISVTPPNTIVQITESDRNDLENCLSMVSKIYALLSSDRTALANYTRSLKGALTRVVSRYLDEGASAID